MVIASSLLLILFSITQTIHLNKDPFFEKNICPTDADILAQKETSVIKTFLFRKSDFNKKSFNVIELKQSFKGVL